MNTSFAHNFPHIDDAKARIVEDLFMKNGYFQSNGEFSVKNSSQQDCYFKNMNEFVDDKLDMVVEKLAEKKSLNTVNNTLKCVIVKLEEETNVVLKENHNLTDKYNKEFDINTKMNEECDSLLDTLTDLRERIESYRISEHANINAMREDETELRTALNYNQQQFNLQKNIWKDELREQKEHIQDLEEENRAVQLSLKDYQAKYKYCVKLENEKVAVFKEKNKILDQLIHEEKATLKATTNKRVFDITKTFCKKLDQRKINQAIDTTRGIIDLSSPKLFNTTLNSIRHTTLEKSRESKEFGGSGAKNHRSSLSKLAHSGLSASKHYD